MKKQPSDTQRIKGRVAILMATYNGERFLPEQLDSILAQSFTDWRLYIQDDLSTDATPQILRHYAATDSRIQLIGNNEKLGAMRNFERLMRMVEADYYFFADQDDVWTKEKMALSLQRLREVEQRSGMKGKPVAVCTDLRVVDAELNEMAPSFWEMQRIEPCLIKTLAALGAHCFATGCTMAFNAAARTAALPLPPEAIMHDVWLSLAVLHNGGALEGIPQPTVLYRQHGNNTIGATNDTHHYIQRKLGRIRQVWRANVATYKMLRKVGYGSWAKYAYNKWRYFWRYNRLKRVSPFLSRPMVSVCIATYNGAAVVREQLESILPQLAPTDEIIISDDGSTDNTLNVVRSLNSPLIRIVQGPARQSPIWNFENALREARGDVVFLSDQDDCWTERKVEVMLDALQRADCVVSDCYVTDSELNVTAESFFKLNDTHEGRYYNLLRRNGYQGCCMSLRSCVLKKALPFPQRIPLHDIWIGNVAAFYFRLAFLPEPLLYYRRHGNNASASAEESSFSLFRKMIFRLNTIQPLLCRYFIKGGITK